VAPVSIEPRSRREPALFAFFVGVVTVASPLRALWAGPRAAWWTPFVVWAALIALVIWSSFRWRRDGG
jgi:membrane protein implicated in regulation of membrane protease activity